MRKLWITILICGLAAVVFAGGIGTGILIQGRNAETLSVSKDSVQKFQLVEDAWNTARDNYVDKTATEPQKLAYGAIAGMIDSLGRHRAQHFPHSGRSED